MIIRLIKIKEILMLHLNTSPSFLSTKYEESVAQMSSQKELFRKISRNSVELKLKKDCEVLLRVLLNISEDLLLRKLVNVCIIDFSNNSQETNTLQILTKMFLFLLSFLVVD